MNILRLLAVIGVALACAAASSAQAQTEHDAGKFLIKSLGRYQPRGFVDEPGICVPSCAHVFYNGFGFEYDKPYLYIDKYTTFFHYDNSSNPMEHVRYVLDLRHTFNSVEWNTLEYKPKLEVWCPTDCVTEFIWIDRAWRQRKNHFLSLISNASGDDARRMLNALVFLKRFQPPLPQHQFD